MVVYVRGWFNTLEVELGISYGAKQGSLAGRIDLSVPSRSVTERGKTIHAV